MAALPLPLLLFAILLLPPSSHAQQQQQNIRTFFPSIPSPAFLNPPPPPPPPPTPPASSPPTSSSPPSSSSRHDVTVAVVSTAFSSFALSALFFFLFLHFTSKRSPPSHPLTHSSSGHKANPRLQPLPQEAKLKHDIVDESGLDAIYWREFEKENGYRPPSDRFSGRTPANSSGQSPSRPPSAEGRRNSSPIGSDHGEEQDRKQQRPGWLRKKKKEREEPLIPPGSLDSTSSVFYDSVGSSTSFDSFPPQTAGYDMSPLPPPHHHPVSDEFIKEVHTVSGGASGARPGNAQLLRPPPGRHHSTAGKPPLHPTASHLSPPALLQPQLPLPPSRLGSSSSKPAVVSAESESIESSSSNPFLPPPPGRQTAAAAAAASQEPLITIESIPAPDSSPPHEEAGSSLLKFATVPGPPPVTPPPPPRASSPSPPPPPPPGGRGGPPPPPPPGGRGGPPPPPPPGGRGGPPPPPPPGGRGRGGPPPPPGGRGGAPSLRPPASPGHPPGPTGPRMKPLHWDVMRKLNPDHSMVWDRFKEGGSFRFDEESMEALFGATAAPSRLKPTEASDANTSTPAALPQIILLEPRKSQNIAIVLRSLACTRQDILDALLEGHGDLTIDTLEKLSKLGLAKEEKELIRDFNGDPSRLSYAESFLFELLRSVPNAFERVEALLFRSTYAHEVANVRQSLQILEHACKELRGSALFFKLLEAVLKAGNRMNAGTARGNAQAFNLASLHKLSDVKATDGSTTLLHFIVEEVVRAEGKRSAINSSFGLRRTPSIASNKSGEDGSAAAAAREERHLEYMQLGLPIVARISSEMASVKRAAGLDYDTLVAVCASLENRLSKIKRFLSGSTGDAFVKEIQGFVDEAEQEISSVKIEQDRVLELVKRTTEYYHSGASKERNSAPLQLFVIVKDFLAMVDKVCGDIGKKQQQQQHQLQKKLAAAGGGASTAEDGGGSRSGRKDGLDGSVKKDGAERSGRRGEGATDGDGRRIMPRFPNLPPNFMSENRESDSSSDED